MLEVFDHCVKFGGAWTLSATERPKMLFFVCVSLLVC